MPYPHFAYSFNPLQRVFLYGPVEHWILSISSCVVAFGSAYLEHLGILDIVMYL